MSGVWGPVLGSLSEAEKGPFGVVEKYLLRRDWTLPSTGWAILPIECGFLTGCILGLADKLLCLLRSKPRQQICCR